MQFYPIYQQGSQEVLDQFIQTQSHCYLLTQSEKGTPRFGIFNHVYRNGCFYLHLNKNDEQVRDLRTFNRAMISIHDFLSVIPSYWVDQKYAGASTSYYRYAEFECIAKWAESEEETQLELQKLMDHYQPEGKYEPLDASSSTYRASFSSLVIVRLEVQSKRTKWKLGQNRPKKTRLEIVQHLRERGGDNDIKAAQEVLLSLKGLNP